MKVLHSFICCLVFTLLSGPALSEETQVVEEAQLNCEQQAIELGVQGEEFDIFITDCEMSNDSQNIIDESIPDLTSVEQ